MRNHLLKLAAALLLALGLFVAARAAGPTDVKNPDPTASVRAVLDAQVAAWNRGDLTGYMAGYAQSPELTFYSGGTVTLGWQPTLDRYRRRYQQEGRVMGKLAFGEVHIELLAEGAALARGRWHLTFPDGKPSQGLFTVLLKKGPAGFRIVHDHSSAE